MGSPMRYKDLSFSPERILLPDITGPELLFKLGGFCCE